MNIFILESFNSKNRLRYGRNIMSDAIPQTTENDFMYKFSFVYTCESQMSYIN